MRPLRAADPCLLQLAPQALESLVEHSLHRHRTHPQFLGKASVAASRQHHLGHHPALPRLQAFQQGLEGSRGVAILQLLGLDIVAAEGVQQRPIQG